MAFRGWALKKHKLSQIQKQASNKQSDSASQIAAGSKGVNASASPAISPNDFEPNFEQKEVDIKIGLDVAWLSSKSIVDKIILVTGDTDLVPAMKFARREGVQVIIANIVSSDAKKNNYLRGPLREHADEVRTLELKNGNWVII
ncbi:MAG: NYN domain-containing protein [Candidatus Cohnella colombiensis]|uniref:NYN domain-containing protein n=1 Tax=Candidatus Cohnella colombiensis TaxID=3121368 RepID=A0AA95EYW8_9BACL|nr:MAG: NYN domain-containing protein [Cohnella sp.]